MKNPNDRPLIDEKVLLELKELENEGSADLVTSVIKIFLDTASEDIQQMNTALSESNLELLVKIAHRFKSSCFSLGAMTMGEAAEELEILGKKNTTLGAEKNLNFLLETLPNVILEFRRFIRENYGT